MNLYALRGMRYLWSTACALFLIMKVTGTPVFAQQPPAPADLPLKQVALVGKSLSLTDVVAILAKQIGHGILVDDEPLRKEAAFDFQGSAKDALDRVADQFDYTWSLSKYGIIIMSKRFKNPDELPQMNLPEMRQMALEAVTLLRAISFDPVPIKWMFLGKTFLATFSPEEQQQLRDGKTLYAGALAPAQRDVLLQMVLNRRFADPFYNWRRLFAELDSAPHAYLQLREWPTFYQLRDHKPITSTPDQRHEIYFSYVFQQEGKESEKRLHFERVSQAKEKKP